MASTTSLKRELVVTSQEHESPDLPKDSPYTLKPDNHLPADLAYSVPPSQYKVVQEY